MTVIAWDGKTVAADRLMCYGDLIEEVTKIQYVCLDIVGFTGNYEVGLMLTDWYRNGRHSKTWPSRWQEDDEWWSELIVVPAGSKKARIYGRTGLCLEYDPPWAFGSGKEMAIGAMKAGATAKEAVEIAIEHLQSCGKGIDELEVVFLDKGVVPAGSKKEEKNGLPS